jgi:hypothetical protein
MKPHIVLLFIGMQIAIASPAYSVHGREYVERERQIVKMTKQMVQQSRDAHSCWNWTPSTSKKRRETSGARPAR